MSHTYQSICFGYFFPKVGGLNQFLVDPNGSKDAPHAVRNNDQVRSRPNKQTVLDGCRDVETLSLLVPESVLESVRKGKHPKT
jgi:hypothetical protein